MSSLCNPTGLAVLAASDGAAGLGSTTVATAGASAGVTGISTAQAGLNATAAATGVTAVGYAATELVIGDGTGASSGALGLPTPSLAPGFTPSQTYERIPSSSNPPSSTAFTTWSNPSTPQYGAPSNYTFAFDWFVSWAGPWTRWTEDGGIGIRIRCKDGSSAGGSAPTDDTRGAKPGADKAGRMTFTFPTGGTACSGTKRGGFDHVEIVNWPVSRVLGAYYPPGHPDRPAGVEAGEGTLLRRISCIDADGVITNLTQEWTGNIAHGGRYELPALTCPTGSAVSAFGSDWTPAVPGSDSSTVVPDTSTPAWVRDLPGSYPECLSAGADCRLHLYRLDTGAATTCGVAAIDCPDWYVDPARSSNYGCGLGPYQVDLSFCSVFRDPGRVLPNGTVAPNGTSTSSPWPTLELSTQVVARAIGRLADRYGTDACAALGEAVRPRVPATSVPDAVLVCEHLGISTALQWILRVSPDHLAPLVEALVESTDGQPITILEPDCNQLATDGRCLDEDGTESEPEPQPDPSGSGVRPPPNCLDDVGRQQLIESMDEEAHHMATHYGAWGARFQAIASKYGLNVKTGAWNLHSMPHAGPHPWNYHNWVLERMQEADDLAQQFPAAEQAGVFLSEFQRAVVDVVKADPTVVRTAYWKCRDYYRWR
jgi:hypothetical protein